MLEATESLLPILFQREQPRVMCVGFQQDSLDELCRLLESLGVIPAERILASARTIHAGTYLGRGKIDEIKNRLEETKMEALMVDVELSPNQLKNLEKAMGVPVLDRP